MTLTIRMYLDLQEAIHKNQYEKVKEYVDAGADLSIEGNSLLKSAILHNSYECIEELLRQVDPNVGGNYYNGSPLACAIRKGLPYIVDLLLDKGANPNSITPDVWRDYYREGTCVFENELKELLTNAKIQLQ